MALNQMRTFKCRLKAQGYSAGSCLVEAQGQRRLACQATLRYNGDTIARLITSIHLSRYEQKKTIRLSTSSAINLKSSFSIVSDAR